jgi:hypothetical protein
MFHIKVTNNRGRGSTLGAVRVAVICLTLMTLKPKSSRLLEVSPAGVSWGGGGRLRINASIGVSEFVEKVK